MTGRRKKSNFRKIWYSPPFCIIKGLDMEAQAAVVIVCLFPSLGLLPPSIRSAIMIWHSSEHVQFCFKNNMFSYHMFLRV